MVIMKYIKSISLLSLIITASLISTQASELVYTPTNPTFGGNPINGGYLLNKAQAQNKHKAPVTEKSYAERFKDSLERASINKMVREITDLAFGESCDTAVNPNCQPSIFNQDSLFVSEGYEIQIITSTSDSITVHITNTETGEVTIIEVPRFG